MLIGNKKMNIKYNQKENIYKNIMINDKLYILNLQIIFFSINKYNIFFYI